MLIFWFPPASQAVWLSKVEFSDQSIFSPDSREGDADQDPMPLRLTNGSICFGLISSSDYIVSLVKVCQYGEYDVIVLEVPRLLLCFSCFRCIFSLISTVASDDLLSVIEVCCGTYIAFLPILLCVSEHPEHP